MIKREICWPTNVGFCPIVRRQLLWFNLTQKAGRRISVPRSEEAAVAGVALIDDFIPFGRRMTTRKGDKRLCLHMLLSVFIPKRMDKLLSCCCCSWSSTWAPRLLAYCSRYLLFGTLEEEFGLWRRRSWKALFRGWLNTQCPFSALNWSVWGFWFVWLFGQVWVPCWWWWRAFVQITRSGWMGSD